VDAVQNDADTSDVNVSCASMTLLVILVRIKNLFTRHIESVSQSDYLRISVKRYNVILRKTTPIQLQPWRPSPVTVSTNMSG